MRFDRTALLIVCFGGVLAGGCNSNTVTATDGGADASLTDGSTLDAGLDADASFDSGDAGDGGDAAILSDAQIVGVLMTANNGEIAEARLALTNTSNFAVHQFANRMIADHTNANNQLMALEADAGITSASSPLEQQLMTMNEQSDAMLTPLMGNAFDLAYAQAAVQDHQSVLNLIDTQLLPNAQSAQLKSLLTSFRAVIATHLSLSQELVTELGDAGAGDAGLDGAALDGGDAGDAGAVSP